MHRIITMDVLPITSVMYHAMFTLMHKHVLIRAAIWLAICPAIWQLLSLPLEAQLADRWTVFKAL